MWMAGQLILKGPGHDDFGRGLAKARERLTAPHPFFFPPSFFSP